MTIGDREWTRSLGSSPESQNGGNSDDASTFNSYTSFINYMSGKYQYSQLQFVAEFMNKTPPIALLDNGTRSTATKTLVADLMDDHWRFTTELNGNILSRQENVRSRVVVVECETFAFVDRAILDFVAFHYDLNPFDLWFMLERVLVSRHYPESSLIKPSFPSIPLATPRRGMPVALWNGVPSDAVELVVDGAVCFVFGSGRDCPFSTVLILSQFGKIPKTFGQRDRLEASLMAGSGVGNKIQTHALLPEVSTPLDMYVESLVNTPTDTVTTSPVELIFPYLKLVVLRIAAETEQLQNQIFGDKLGRQRLATDDAAIRQDFNIRSRLLGSDFSISRGLTIIRQFMGVHNTESSKAGKEIIEELERLSTFNHRLQNELERYSQMRVALSSLAESRKSIELSNDLGKLTKLAFVFVPLTFTTSIFGMNMTELGSGSLSYRIVLGTGLIIMSVTLLCLYLNDRMARRSGRLNY
ncbi:hypothetical protein QBC43DRAFT_296327 [Cladorrhinum sp. PSN259]|nr:hypothetical protein QBC43DRAFT_296327 [Cladorrhinum sp. PSN259]